MIDHTIRQACEAFVKLAEQATATLKEIEIHYRLKNEDRGG